MKPSLPQGTRDFGPDVVRKRQYIFQTIKNVFELYGFQPLETPAMENLETLTGKYGEEGDKLIFKILNNGLGDEKNIDKSRNAFENVLTGKNDKQLTERALKYDLTIPFARYVATNHGQLTFPFKRYQIQPVWRADRPQRGRYREFYQCDADIVGSKSLLNEVDLVNLYDDVFTQLKITQYSLHINSRKILAALAERCGGPENMMTITIAIDKLDKIGLDKVKEELRAKNISAEHVGIVEKYLAIDGDNRQKLAAVKELFASSATGTAGIYEIEFILTAAADSQRTAQPVVDLTLARGLNYYTGIILEAKAPPQVKIGSIGGGGRYDDLTGLFGVPGIPGVGISFGVDRMYDVMEELNLFPEAIMEGTKVLFFNMGKTESKLSYSLVQAVRKAGTAAELFHDEQKFDKQFKYAAKKNIPFIVIIGSKELEEKTAVVKDLRTGKQQNVSFVNLPQFSFI